MSSPASLAADRAVDRPGRGGKRDVWLIYWIFPAFYFVFFVIFCPLARVTCPPPRPDVTAQQAADFFHAHAVTIQIAFCLLFVVVGGAAVTNGLVVYQMKRMSVGSLPAYGYMAGMSVGALPGCLLVAVCFLTATLRPGRDPNILRMLYDLGMLSYNGSLGCFNAAYFALALAILFDRNGIFPKWFAYLTIWQIVTELVATQMFVSKAGPFAWNGAIAFWWAVVVFGTWLVCLIVLLKRAAETEPVDAPPLD